MNKIYVIFLMLFAITVAISGCVGSQVTNFDECVAAGYPVMESYPRQCSTGSQTFVEEIGEMNEILCSSSGGHWNECSNRCAINNQGTDVYCPQVCEPLCECGGIAGFSCPEGYFCYGLDNAVISDPLGYCVHGIPFEQAMEIAASACENLTNTYYYNEATETWWIDLDIEKEGCAPACVVSEQGAEINWRCTGLTE